MHGMVPYFQSFSSLRKPLLQILLKFWSTGEEETVRVLSFLCISKVALNTKSNIFFNGLLKVSIRNLHISIKDLFVEQF